MRLASASALQNLHRPWPSRIARTLAVALVLAFPAALLAQDAPRPRTRIQGRLRNPGFRAPLRCRGRDDRQELLGQGAAGRHRLGASARRRCAKASSRPTSFEEAASRINALLGELKTSHTALLTPDDVNYYILMAVFQRGVDAPAGIRRSILGRGRDVRRHRSFLGADRGARLRRRGAGRIAGRSRGPEGGRRDSSASMALPIIPSALSAARSARRSPSRSAVREGGPTETLRIKVMSIAPLHAFREATRASARVIERDGRRIGYVHVWASVGEESRHGPAERAVQPRDQRVVVAVEGRQESAPPPTRRSDRRHARQDRRHGQHCQALPGPARPARPPARFARQVPAFARRDRAAGPNAPFSSINIREAPRSCSCTPTSASGRVR